VHQQVAHGHLARDVGVRHLEPRDIVDDRRVPPDLAFVDENPQRRRGEHLGVRRDAEERARIDRIRRADAADAVPLRHHDPAVLHDGQGNARDVERGHRAPDPRIGVGGQGRGRLSGAGRAAQDPEHRDEWKDSDSVSHGAAYGS
jgi:hypothetical protein